MVPARTQTSVFLLSARMLTVPPAEDASTTQLACIERRDTLRNRSLTAKAPESQDAGRRSCLPAAGPDTHSISAGAQGEKPAMRTSRPSSLAERTLSRLLERSPGILCLQHTRRGAPHRLRAPHTCTC